MTISSNTFLANGTTAAIKGINVHAGTATFSDNTLDFSTSSASKTHAGLRIVGTANVVRNTFIIDANADSTAIEVTSGSVSLTMTDSNVRVGTTGTITGVQYGVAINGIATLTLKRNRIHVTESTATANNHSLGVASTGGSCSIGAYDNIISTGTGTGSVKSHALYIMGNGIIRGNTLISDTSTTQTSILRTVSAGTHSIDNNVFVLNATDSATRMCLLVEVAGATLSSVKNNAFIGCSRMVIHATAQASCNNSGTCDDISEVNGLTNASGNVTESAAAANFLNASTTDFHFTSSSPTSLTEGGLDGSSLAWPTTTDFDSVTRTAPWSIGAFELD